MFRFLSAVILLLAGAGPAAAEDLLAAFPIWPPFMMAEPDGRSPTGIAVEILAELERRTPHRIALRPMPVKRVEQAMERGEVDINPMDSPLWSDPAEAAGYTFSDIVMTTHEHVYLSVDLDGEIVDPSDLAGLRLGQIAGYRYPVLDRLFDSGKIRRVELGKNDQLFRLLSAGRIDGFLMDEMLFDHLVHTGALNPIRIRRALQVSQAPLGIKVRTGVALRVMEDINAALKAMTEDGTLDGIVRRYTGKSASLANGTRS